MRRVFYSMVRGLVAVSVIVFLATSASALPRDERDRWQGNPLAKIIKRIVKSLGDGLIIPLP
ncbi:MAG: hypothetical protein ABI779_21570 [Acidobacteriota bacterium]